MKDFLKYLLQFASFLYFLDIVFDEVLSSLSQVFKPRKCNHRISLVKYFRNTSHNFKCTEFLHKPGNKELPEAVVLRRSVIKVLLNNAQNSKESTCAKFTFNKVLLAFSYPALLLRNCRTVVLLWIFHFYEKPQILISQGQDLKLLLLNKYIYMYHKLYVWHQWHCVNSVRNFPYSDWITPNTDAFYAVWGREILLYLVVYSGQLSFEEMQNANVFKSSVDDDSQH